MRKRHAVAQTLLLGLVILLYSCNNESDKPIPEKHPELSQSVYDKNVDLLKEAYSTGNDFDAALQLANLKAEGSSAFQLLNKAIEENPSKCDEIYEWYWLHSKHGFGITILRLDSTEFKKTVTLCDRLNPDSPYQKFAEMKAEKAEKERQAKENKSAKDMESGQKD